jgi:hypothetical protein
LDVQGDRVVGKIYRSAIFEVSSNYDDDISLTPEKGGETSRQFEVWVRDTYGLRPDRARISDGDEHFCIEAPANEDGQAQLTELVQKWGTQVFNGIQLIYTGWFPRDISKRIAHINPPTSEERARYQAALTARDDEIAAQNLAHQSNVAAARQEQEKYAATLERSRAEREAYERARQAYREEYKRVTGTYPPE